MDTELLKTCSGNFLGTSKREHFVQFYDRETVLVSAVSGYFAGAFRGNDAAVMIATLEHRKAVEAQLSRDGFDVPALEAAGHYFPFDAEGILSEFMSNGLPDKKLFTATIGAIMETANHKGRCVRAFGEMVALLWAEGNKEAALLLEDFWNDLVDTYCFSLFCAYPLSGFENSKNPAPFVHICQRHSHVIPG